MKCFRLVRSVLVVSLVCLAGTVRADLVPNGGFDTGVSGWTATSELDWIAPTAPNASPDGGSAQFNGANWLYQPGDTTPPAFVAGQTYELSFLAADLGGSGSAILTAGITLASREIDTPVTTTSTWQQYNVVFTAKAADVGQPFQPEFLGAANTYFGIDTVGLYAISTPEPSTLVLLLVGTLGLLAYAWRKRR